MAFRNANICRATMKLESPLPAFDRATEWLNRSSSNFEPRKLSDSKGRPTLVHFWSINSEISKANLTQLAKLRDERKHEGLRVIAVHVLSADEEVDAKEVHEAVTRLNITEPCAVDDAFKLRDAFS